MNTNGMLIGAQRYPHPNGYPHFMNHSDANVNVNVNVNQVVPDDTNGMCQNVYVKAPNSHPTLPAGSVTINSTPPPSIYPMPGSWPNYNQNMGRNEAEVAFHEYIINSPASRIDNPQFRQNEYRGVCTFTTAMVNEATTQRAPSLHAWHTNFCRPSTSNADTQPARPVRRRKQNLKGSPSQMTDNVSKNSPLPPAQIHPQHHPYDHSAAQGNGLAIVTRPQSSQVTSSQIVSHSNTTAVTNAGLPSLPASNSITGNCNSVNVSAAADLVIVPDENELEINGEGPLRRMEKMTHETLFEPLNKQPRTNNVDNIQSTKRDEDRNAKLAKVKSIGEQICGKRDWDRVMHETQGCNAVPSMMQSFSHVQFAPPVQPALMQPQSQQIFQTCRQNFVQPVSSNQMMQGVSPSQLMQGVSSNQLMQQVSSNQLMQGVSSNQMMQGVSSNQIMQQVSSQMMHPVSSNQMMQQMGAVNVPNMVQAPMPMSQPLRPSLNGPPYGSQYPHEAFYNGQIPMNAAYPHYEHPQELNQMMPNCYPGVFHPNATPVMHPRGYLHPQDMRPVYPPRLPAQMEMWNNHLPQPINNIEARVPNQKIQYNSSAT